ncbi:MAG: hypothetical protein Q7T04_02815 [Dehalococcoidia bacterium]|nr:hypothetical protein [Dehalococcoidia bacterium]
MGEIKSAFEKAMERVEKLGKATPEELAKLESLPLGNGLAARFLREPDFDLKGELAKFPEPKRKFVTEGARETFLSNIVLPQTGPGRESTKRAMQGVLNLKTNKAKAQAVVAKMEHLLNYYEQARQQTYAKLKEAFEAKLRENPALLQQMGLRGGRVEIETLPQFQMEARRVMAELGAQYERVLDEHKKELKSVP